jgi:hypothetical protein
MTKVALSSGALVKVRLTLKRTTIVPVTAGPNEDDADAEGETEGDTDGD